MSRLIQTTMREALFSFNRALQKHGFLIGAVAMVFTVAGYMAYQLSFLLGRPDLHLEFPASRFTVVREPFADILGRADDASKILINNRPVEFEGRQFNERLYLAAGVNRIMVEAVNDRGRSVRRESFLVFIP